MLLASAAIATQMTLSGCGGGAPVTSGRHMQPLSERMLATLKAKNMERDSPILMRVFKEEAELEVWKQDDSGRFALLRTYPICRWSGELGPKIKQGDRQAPEGFYTITPGLMNPDSSQYLAINTGFPNAYDRANGCQSASKFDPRSASNFDPLERRVRAVALAPSELVGVAETARVRVVG